MERANLTASAIIKFAQDLEERSMRFYEELARSALGLRCRMRSLSTGPGQIVTTRIPDILTSCVRVRESNHCCLGRRVDSEIGLGLSTGAGCYVDDASALAWLHILECRARAVEHTLHVDGNQGIPFGRGHVLEGFADAGSGIVR